MAASLSGCFAAPGADSVRPALGRRRCRRIDLGVAQAAGRRAARRFWHRGAQNHGLLEIGDRRLPRAGLVHVLELVLADFDDVIVLQKMLLDRAAVDQRAVGAAQVLQKRIVQDRHDQGVLAADRQVVDLNVVVRLAPDRDPLLVERHFPDHRVVQTQYQLRHGSFPVTVLSKPGQEFGKPTGRRRKILQHPHQYYRHIVAPAVVVGHLHQLLRRQRQIRAAARRASS